MGIGELIKSKRLQKGLTLAGLAKKCSVAESTVQRWESGSVADIKLSKAQTLSKVLDIDPMVLITGAPDFKGEVKGPFEVENMHTIPVYGMVSAGLGTYADDEIIDYEYAPEKFDRDSYFYLEVEGDSMEPEIHAGDRLLVYRTPSVESGTIAVILIDNEEGVVKKVIYDERSVTLLSFNKKYEPRVFKDEEKLRLRVQGEVIEAKRKFR